MKFIHAAPFYYYFSPRFILRAFFPWRIATGLCLPAAFLY